MFAQLTHKNNRNPKSISNYIDIIWCQEDGHIEQRMFGQCRAYTSGGLKTDQTSDLLY